MTNLEQHMKEKLDGTFREWSPNKGEFSTRRVPATFVPDHGPRSYTPGGTGKYAPKCKPSPEMLPEAIDLLKQGLKITRARYVLAARFNISHESAFKILKQARKAMEE